MDKFNKFGNRFSRQVEINVSKNLIYDGLDDTKCILKKCLQRRPSKVDITFKLLVFLDFFTNSMDYQICRTFVIGHVFNAIFYIFNYFNCKADKRFNTSIFELKSLFVHEPAEPLITCFDSTKAIVAVL